MCEDKELMNDDDEVKRLAEIERITNGNAPGYATHEVLSRAGVLANHNAYTDDKPLVDAMRVFGADLICP